MKSFKFDNETAYCNCYNLQVQRDYKFYLALENSLCRDYVTEKFYGMAEFNVILIVFDLHGNFKRFAPEKSYINALDFPSVRDLADYIKLLDANDTLYNEYFEWKRHYVVRNEKGMDLLRGLCRMCSILHEPVEPVSIYHNLTKWWRDDSQCKILEFLSKEEDPTGSHIWKARDYDASDQRTYWTKN